MAAYLGLMNSGLRHFFQRFGVTKFGSPTGAPNWNAWSHGQVLSKISLCEHLEACFADRGPQRIWVLAGWYGLLPFMLLSRGRVQLEAVRVFDEDPDAVKTARRVNNALETEGRFAATLADVNRLAIPSVQEGGPTLIVNTSCEHFHGMEWWNAIPAGTWVALQGTDMPHEEHVRSYRSLEEFRRDFPGLDEVAIADEKRIISGNKDFRRFTLIGKKVSR